jgi:hypothetical protein
MDCLLLLGNAGHAGRRLLLLLGAAVSSFVRHTRPAASADGHGSLNCCIVKLWMITR